MNLKQLSYARKYNRNTRYALQDEYIFELFFQLGIDKNDLVNRNYPAKIENLLIKDLIEKMYKSGKNIELGTITSYFTRLTNYLKEQGLYDENRRDINSYDLNTSHKAYFLNCPNCGNGPFETTADNWVLAKTRFEDIENQDEYHIVCVQCKGAPNAN